MANLLLFQQAVKEYEVESAPSPRRRMSLLSNSSSTSSLDDGAIEEAAVAGITCPHPMFDVGEGGEKICAMCGELLQANHLVVENLSAMKQRRKRECTLFDEIPFFISEKTRDTAIDIFRLVMGNTTNRTMRRVVLLACVHRASILCKESVSFDDLVEMSGIKPNRACRGINYVAEKIKKNSTYEIPFFQSDVMVINSIMRNIGLEDQTKYVSNIVTVVKTTSGLLNSSHYKSVVCGCIFFWLMINERNISMAQFSQKVQVSHMTIKKKHFEVKVVILKYILKRIFSNLLQKCVPKISGKKNNYSKIPDTLYKPKDDLFVENYSDPTNVKVRNADKKYLPLDDVTDILQWNILMDTEWYDHRGYEFFLNVNLSIHNNDVLFNFTKYDGNNKENGKNIVANTVIDSMK